MLNLGIQPVHYDFLGCFEDSIISVAQWAGYRYELMFSKAWDFIFDLNNYQESQSLGESLKTLDYCILEELKKYHGIDLTPFAEPSLKKVFEMIGLELKNNRPVMVSMDSFFCPWDWNYEKRHLEHAFLVIGIGDKDEFFCCDGFFRTSKTITKEELERGYYGWYATFSFAGNETVEISWVEILQNAIVQLKEEKPCNAFDSIRQFIDVLKNTNDLKKEIQGHENNLFEAPLIKKLEIAVYGRRKFAKLLNYFAAETGTETLRELSDNLIKAASIWANVRAMLIKIAFLEDISSIKKRVDEQIKDIPDLEEYTAKQLFELCQAISPSVSVLSNRLPIDGTAEKINVIRLKKLFMIDLSPYFNNKAFAESISKDSLANFTETGAYLLKENIPDTETWKIGELEFKIDGFHGNKDNVSCNGQLIKLQGEQCQSIIILGTAEWGSFTDKLTIHFMSGQTEEINIRFSEWIYKPLYGETIVWEGRAVEKINEDMRLMGARVHLFAQRYHIKTMDQIDFLQLPDCPGVHIFAITLA